MNRLIGYACGLLLWMAPGVLDAQPRLVIDADGSWKAPAITGKNHGHRVYVGMAGGSLNARGLSRACSGFIAGEPALVLEFARGAGAVKLTVHADQELYVIAYATAGKVHCSRVADYRSTLVLQPDSHRYRLYIAGTMRHITHPYLLTVSPDDVARLRREQACKCFRKQPDAIFSSGRPDRETSAFEEGEIGPPLSSWMNTRAPPEVAVPIPHPGRPPVIVMGRFAPGHAGVGRDCSAIHTPPQHRFAVTEDNTRVRIRVRGEDHVSPVARLVKLGRDGETDICILADKQRGRADVADEVIDNLKRGIYGLKVAVENRPRRQVEYSVRIDVCSKRPGTNACQPQRTRGKEYNKVAGGHPASQLFRRGGARRGRDNRPGPLSAVVRLWTSSGPGTRSLCTATNIDWFGKPALVTAAHCLYRTSGDELTGRLATGEVEGHGQLSLEDAIIATSFARCADAGRGYRSCIAGGADDIAVIPWTPDSRSSIRRWRLCRRAPRGDRVSGMGYGLTETGRATDDLLAGELGLVRRAPGGQGVWRSRGHRTLVQPGDSGGPVTVMPVAIDSEFEPEVCFVISGLDNRTGSFSLLQPAWDIEQRLRR